MHGYKLTALFIFCKIEVLLLIKLKKANKSSLIDGFFSLLHMINFYRIANQIDESELDMKNRMRPDRLTVISM